MKYFFILFFVLQNRLFVDDLDDELDNFLLKFHPEKQV